MFNPFCRFQGLLAQNLCSHFVTIFIKVCHPSNFGIDMNLVFDLPVDFVVQLFGEWLTLRNICDLEVAMCSADNRLRLGTIHESLVLEGKYDIRQVVQVEKQLDWFLVRKIRVRSVAISPISMNAIPKYIALLKHSSTQLQHLSLHRNNTSLNLIAASVARYCTGLKFLEADDMILPAPFFAMLGQLHNLEDLTITFGEILDAESLNGISCPSVQNLRLEGDYSLQIQEKMLKTCPNLVTYYLAVQHAVLKDLPPTLESLTIEECESIQIINLNGNLKKIEFTCYNMSDESVAGIFTFCPHVEVLNLAPNAALTNTTLSRIADTYGHSLRELIIFGWNNVDSRVVKYLGKKCSQLIALAIGGACDVFDPNCIVEVLDNCPSLRKLEIPFSEVTDEVLMKIGAAPLEFLYMHDVRGVTEDGIKALVRGCAALKTISINDKLLSPLVKFVWQELRPDLQFK